MQKQLENLSVRFPDAELDILETIQKDNVFSLKLKDGRVMTLEEFSKFK